MKTLLLLRHAKSSWKDRQLRDHDRPLNKRGRGAAQRMGQLLRTEAIVPQLIVSSSAVRAMETTQRLMDAGEVSGPMVEEPMLYHADPDEILDVIQRLPDVHDRVMLVGHNPGMEELVALLTGHFERMPTGALARIQVPIPTWRDIMGHGRCRLVNFWRPRELAEVD